MYLCSTFLQKRASEEEQIMTETITNFEQELLHEFRKLSDEKQREVLDFVAFLLSKIRTKTEQPDETDASSVVEETWGNLSLDRETLIYIAEDKELEYDV
jgi:uncharacterized UBP type Zn finger protein